MNHWDREVQELVFHEIEISIPDNAHHCTALWALLNDESGIGRVILQKIEMEQYPRLFEVAQRYGSERVGESLKVGEKEINWNTLIEYIPSSSRGISYDTGDVDMKEKEEFLQDLEKKNVVRVMQP